MRATIAKAVAGAAVALLAGACSTQTPPEDAKAPATTYEMNHVYMVQLPEPAEAESAELKLELDAPLNKCYREDPNFAYDKAEPKPQEYVDLALVAGCLKSDAHLESRILLVGRADERGPSSYNEKLGRKRAQQVKEILTGYGVDEERVMVLSEGEAKAKGHLEDYSHGYDRRVDVIQLMDRAPR